MRGCSRSPLRRGRLDAAPLPFTECGPDYKDCKPGFPQLSLEVARSSWGPASASRSTAPTRPSRASRPPSAPLPRGGWPLQQRRRDGAGRGDGARGLRRGRPERLANEIEAGRPARGRRPVHADPRAGPRHAHPHAAGREPRAGAAQKPARWRSRATRSPPAPTGARGWPRAQRIAHQRRERVHRDLGGCVTSISRVGGRRMLAFCATRSRARRPGRSSGGSPRCRKGARTSCFGTSERDGPAGPVCALYEGHRVRTIDAPGSWSPPSPGSATAPGFATAQEQVLPAREGDDFVPLPVPGWGERSPAASPAPAMTTSGPTSSSRTRSSTSTARRGRGCRCRSRPLQISGRARLHADARARAALSTGTGSGGRSWTRWSPDALARGRDDVWLAAGCPRTWHPAPGPNPLRLSPPDLRPTDALAPTKPRRFRSTPPKPRAAVERASFAVAGGAPLLRRPRRPRGRRRRGASSCGWAGVIEVDKGGKARALHGGTPAPEDGSRVDPARRRRARAASARPRGARPRRPTGDRHPPASWSVLADAPGGGVWLAGGLNPGPSERGSFCYAGGRFGAVATLRVRATRSLARARGGGPGRAALVRPRGSRPRRGRRRGHGRRQPSHHRRASGCGGPRRRSGRRVDWAATGTGCTTTGARSARCPIPSAARAAFTAIAWLRWSCSASAIRS